MATLDRSAIDAIQSRYRVVKEDMYTKTFSEPLLENFMMVTNRDETVLPSATIGKGLQSAQVGHHSKGNIKFTARQLQKEGAKFDLTFDVGKFSQEYYFSYMKENGNDPREFPYEDFVIQIILNQLWEDFTLDALWQGKKLGPIAGAPNNPGDIANGLLTHIVAAVLAGELVVTPTGIPTSSDAVEKAETFVWNCLGKASESKKAHFLFCSQTFIRNYMTDYRESFGTNAYENDPFKKERLMISGTNTQLVAQDGLFGNELILAKQNNPIVGFDGAPWIVFDYSSRQLKVEIDWSFAMNFHSMIDLHVNEWALPASL